MYVLQFEDVQSFMVHVENLLQLRDQLSEKEKKEQEEVEQLRKELQTLEDQHRVRWLHMNNQRSQLHKELNEMSSEALTWVPNAYIKTYDGQLHTTQDQM